MTMTQSAPPRPFGTTFTEHMFIMEWNSDKGWHNQRIQAYKELSMSPASSNLHYGQEIFEGIKAFKTVTGRYVLFRPRNNLERMNCSAKIMCMPPINVEVTLSWLKKLIVQDHTWIPTGSGKSLYIRPTMIATESTLNLNPSTHYLFFIILPPVEELYHQGLNPVPILVTEKYTRASSGGVGQAKAAGNYAASMRALQEARVADCVQVLWLDPIERLYIEEVGAMNFFCVINNVVVTPLLTDSILAGITRLSLIELCKSVGIPVEERRLSINELIKGIEDGSVQELFGSGTAAVVTPIGSLRYKDTVHVVNNNKTGPITERLFTLLTAIQYGIGSDDFNWLEPVNNVI